ncbi:MAG TPA: helix-turn-helix domain-containing protein [Thermoanaerobaculia bacterium]
MPTLQRYKKMYQARIPSEGKGRKQRYPENALPVFDELRRENMGKRGRPRKDPNAPRPAASKRGGAKRGRPPAAAKPAAAKTAKKAGGRKAGSQRPAAAAGRRGRPRKAAAGGAGGGQNLMTLTQISEQTGISYPTLVRYVRDHSDRLPHEGKGRGRRFHPEAVSAFRALREEGGRGGRKAGAAKGGAAKTGAKKTGAKKTGARRGRPPGSRNRTGTGAGGGEGVLQKRLRELERSQQNLEKKLKGFVRSIQSLFR